jgi:chromosome segregation ATPase
MMNHERTERELQEVFEEIQRSYKALVNNAFELQEQTLEVAHSLYNSSEEAQYQSTRATLEALAEQSRSQREALEALFKKSEEAFMKVLKAPYDTHHQKIEEARADLEELSSEESSRT